MGQRAGVGVNEHTPREHAAPDVESKDQRELLIGSRVTDQVDIGKKKSRLQSVAILRVIEVRVAGEIVIKEEAVARVER